MDNSKVNYDALRIRLEFLFRIIHKTVDVLDERGDEQNKLEGIISIITTVGCHLIYKHRIDGTFRLDHEETVNGRGIGDLIAHQFQVMINKIIDNEKRGLPITLSFGKTELIVQSGIDDLMEVIKVIIEKKEVSNG